MLGNLIWTICYKLVWFYPNALSFHIIFIVTPGEIFTQLGHSMTYTGIMTVNKMALPSMYRRRWCYILAFIERNTIALGVQRFAAGANVIGLTYATDWWAVIGPVIHGEATRSSLDHVGLLHTLSTIGTQESKLRVCLVLEVLAKLIVWENLSWEFP